MKRHLAHAFFVAFVGAALLGVAIPIQAQPQQDIYSPVILGAEYFSPGRRIQIKEDGSGLQVISISGDLTHNGVDGRRYFLRRELVSGEGFPDGSQYYDLVSYNESGDPTTRRLLTSDRTVFRNDFGVWSVDGTRVAYFGRRYDLVNVVEDGIFVGEVVYDANGGPSGIENERLAVPIAFGWNDAVWPILSWSWDNLRVTYSVTKDYASVSRQDEIYVAYLPPVGSSLPAPPYRCLNCKIELTNGSWLQIDPEFSRVDNQLAFIQNIARSGCTRNHIFVVEVPVEYDGTYALTATQITNKTNANLCQMARPEWSSDGMQLAFDAWDLRLKTPQIYKIESHGSGNAVKLTNSKNAGYFGARWRK